MECIVTVRWETHGLIVERTRVAKETILSKVYIIRMKISTRIKLIFAEISERVPR